MFWEKRMPQSKKQTAKTPRVKKVLKSYRLEQKIIDALNEAVIASRGECSETDIVSKLLKKGLGLK